MTAQPPAAGAARRADRAAAPDAAALPAQRRPRRPRHRPGATLGPRRNPAGAARRGGRRPRRATRRQRRRAAGLPAGKTFASWRETDSSIPAPTQHALATLEWLGRAENLAVTGPSGTGKTHLVEALAHAAIDTGRRVAWFTLESLTAAVGRAKADGSVARTITRITRADLIVVDDIGMLPAGQAAAEALYRVVDAAYERRSVAVTSNLHPSGFDTIMPKTLATATVDRLLHHAHIVLTEGTSLRLAEATAGKGVIPLT